MSGVQVQRRVLEPVSVVDQQESPLIPVNLKTGWSTVVYEAL